MPVLSKFRRGWKRALLVGINYEESEDMETLKGSHRSVEELKRLLIGVYHYDDMVL